MKITWNKQPLYSSIHLTDDEKKIYKMKIKIELMQEALWTAHFHLDYKDGKYFDLNRAKEEINADYDELADKRLKLYVDELENGGHFGDCVCIPATCFRCVAEDNLGFSTIENLGKHSAHKIMGIFDDKSVATIDDAVHKLENMEYNFDKAKIHGWKSKADYDQHIPRWQYESKRAAEWMKKYKEQFEIGSIEIPIPLTESDD